MRVFLSWSGATSRQIAEILYGWIPKVLQAVEPFLSSQDIEKGERWLSSISTNLENIDVGIVVMTRSNVFAPWINFEAGALSKKIDRSRIIPVLFEITDTDLVNHPLAQFQYVKLEKDDLLRLFRMLNLSCPKPLSETQFDETFTLWFDRHFELLQKIKPSTATVTKQSKSSGEPEEVNERFHRMEAAIDEILNYQRRQKNSSDRLKTYEDGFLNREALYTVRVKTNDRFSPKQAEEIAKRLEAYLPDGKIFEFSPREIMVGTSHPPSLKVISSIVEEIKGLPSSLIYQVTAPNVG